MKPNGLATWLLVLTAIAVFCLAALPAAAGDDPLHPPWDQEPCAKELQPAAGQSRSLGSGFFCSLLIFFQRVISPVDGDRCPSYPTCSAYSLQVYRQHGAVLGTLMTVDRLLHEASEDQFSPRIEVNGVSRIYDPPAANEFWKRGRVQDGAE